jgi:hypothetical protein
MAVSIIRGDSMRREYAVVGLWIILWTFDCNRICRRILFFQCSTKTNNRSIGSSGCSGFLDLDRVGC